MAKCKNCINLDRQGWCEKAIDSPEPNRERECYYFQRMTNADRIRAMTDEELYAFLNAFVTHQEDVWCPYKDDCGTLLGQGHRTMDCRDCIHDWLKKEVEDGDTT